MAQGIKYQKNLPEKDPMAGLHDKHLKTEDSLKRCSKN